MLASLLGDSPAMTRSLNGYSWNVFRDGYKGFSVSAVNTVINLTIAPLLDQDAFSSDEDEANLYELVKSQTDFKDFEERSAFAPGALVPLMFGNLSCGLRQQSIRQILNTTIFDKDKDQALRLLKSLSESKTNELPSPDLATTTTMKKKNREEGWCDIEVATTDSACVVSSVQSDTTVTETQDLSLARVTLSEPEMSEVRTSTPIMRTTGIPRKPNQVEQDAAIRIGDNWLLRENPSFHDDGEDPVGGGGSSCPEASGTSAFPAPRGNQRAFHSLDEIELEVSHDSGRTTVTRLQRMLQETDDRLERLQSEVNAVVPANSAASPRHRSSSLNVWTSEISHNHDSTASDRNINKGSNDSEDEDSLNVNSDQSLSSSSSSSSSDQTSDLESDWMCSRLGRRFEDECRIGGNRRRLAETAGSYSSRLASKLCNDEDLVRALKPSVVESLCDRLNIPPGLRSCMELEVARLQLASAVFNHSAIKCDRDCEGNLSETTTTSDEESDESDSDFSWDNDQFEPSESNDADDDSTDEEEDENDSVRSSVPPFEPSVPQRPRTLSISSNSSAEDEDDFDLPAWEPHPIAMSMQIQDQIRPEDENQEQSDAEPTCLEPEDWFSVGGLEEEPTIRRYMHEQVRDNFDHSTASETDD